MTECGVRKYPMKNPMNTNPKNNIAFVWNLDLIKTNKVIMVNGMMNPKGFEVETSESEVKISWRPHHV